MLGVSPIASCSWRAPLPTVPMTAIPVCKPRRTPLTNTVLLLQTSVQRCHGVDDGQPGAHRPLGGIFVRLRIAKVDEHAITQILRYVAIEGLERRHRSLLVRRVR